MNRLFPLGAALLAATITVTATTSTRAAAETVPSIDWAIDRQDARHDGKVQLSLHSRWGRNSRSNWTQSYHVGELRGLAASQLNAASAAPVRFALIREPGRLDCAGSASRGGGQGTCGFTPDAGFAAELVRRGIGRPDAHTAYSLTMAGVGRGLLDALAEYRYVTPTLSQLTAMGIHGATAPYVRALAASGYRLGSANDLVAFRIHGVDAGYIAALGAANPSLRRVPANDLVAFRIHGVRPELVRAYNHVGDGALQPKDLTAMAIHGVTPAFIEKLAALGYRRLPASDLVQMRIHGVTPEFARAVRARRGNLASSDELVRMRIFGER